VDCSLEFRDESRVLHAREVARFERQTEELRPEKVGVGAWNEVGGSAYWGRSRALYLSELTETLPWNLSFASKRGWLGES
jgi:hypothetical protein